jgi:hypothetical protein
MGNVAMKKHLLFFLFIGFLQFPVQSQNCLPEGIHFTRQSQVDSFQIYYPGCTKIEGFVKISGNDVSNLSGLNVLDSIFGYLYISNTMKIDSLFGLENLEYIGGSFSIEDAHGLHYLNGLDNLSTIGGNLEIAWNDWLFSLDGLQQLTTIGGSVVINENWELASLEGLDNLTTIGGSLMIGDWWSGNDVLSDLDGLNSLTYVGGGLFIGFNPDLANLAGLSNLNTISGELMIIHNASLSSLSGLENIDDSTITHVWIYYNPLLTQCNIQSLCEYLADIPAMIGIYNNGPGCDNPHEIADSCGFDLSCLPYGNYYFASQANVDSFPSYYPDCNRLEGYINIEGDDITHLDSLYGIDTISDLLSICGNPLLTSLSGLDNLRAVNGNLHLGYWEHGSNPLLHDMTGLGKLNYIGGELLFLGNGSLQDFTGLDSLEEIGKWFSVIQNPSLKSFEGLNSLHSVGEIGISGNDSLSSLDGLQSLVNVTYTVGVQNNPLLVSLDGIENINADSMLFLRIRDNDSLSECSVKSVCDFIGIPESNVIIEDNATGCNTLEEVEAGCEVGVNESLVLSPESLVMVYPNPVTADAWFIIQQERPGRVRISLYNNLGQFVTGIIDERLPAGTHNLHWNASGLPAGLYFYNLSECENRKPAMGKLVICR